MAKKLQNLEGLYNFLNDTVNVEDFLEAVKKIMAHIDEKQSENKKELEKVATLIAEKLLEATDKIESEKDRLKDEEKKLKQIHKDTLLDLSERQKSFTELVQAKINSIREPQDGKDADEEEIAMSVYDMLLEKIPDIEDIENDIPKMGERVRDSLELLQGDERLTIDAIKDLREELNKLRKSTALGGAGSGIPLSMWPRHEEFTMDGILDTVVLSQAPAAAGQAVFNVSINGQVQTRSTNYTINGNTITFTFTPMSGDLVGVTYMG